MTKKVVVIAGTPVDTQMGVDYLTKKDESLEVIAAPVSPDPQAQMLFQLFDAENREKIITSIFEKWEKQGVKDFFIYCNSLSASFDFDALATKRGVRVYTPLQVYKAVAGQHTMIAAIAANNQSAHGIERTVCEANPKAQLLGIGLMQLVFGVEAQRDPEELLESCGVGELMKFCEKYGAECLILGCTHFPYFREALDKLTALPIIDPAEIMYENLCKGFLQD